MIEPVAISTNTWGNEPDGWGATTGLLSKLVDRTPTGFSVEELAAAADRITTTIAAQARAEMPSPAIAAAAPARSAFGAAGRIRAIYASALGQAPAPAAVPEHDDVDQVGEEPSVAPAP